MANDRMFLHCDACNAQLLIAKSFGRGWKVWPPLEQPSALPESRLPTFYPDGTLGDLLEDWLAVHSRCSSANAVGSHDHFRLLFEHKDRA